MSSREFQTKLVLTVASTLCRELRADEVKWVLSLLKREDMTRFRGVNTERLCAALAAKYSKVINNYKCDNVVQEMDDYMKTHISSDETRAVSTAQTLATTIGSSTASVASFLGYASLTDILKLVSNTPSKYINVCLDSRNRVLDGSLTRFKWTYSNTPTTEQGTFISVEAIRNIRSIRVNNIRLPLCEGLDQDSKLITLSFAEYNSSGAQAYNNRGYHFQFRPEVDGQYVDLSTFGYNDGIFRFPTRIPNINSLTVSFGNPHELVEFDSDRGVFTVSGYGASTLELTTTTDHRVSTGDRIFISNFATRNPVRHYSLEATINSSKGHEATELSDTMLSIPVAGSEVLVAGAGTISIANASNVVDGTGTNFGAFLTTNDWISFNGQPYKVLSINSNTQLIISSNYSGSALNNIPYFRDNRIPGAAVSVLFGCKEFSIHLEFEIDQ
jgi:hypothetical protein